MNWTGGRLQQSRRAGNTVSAKQKAYFAKARTRLRTGQPTHSPLQFSVVNHSKKEENEVIGERNWEGQRKLEEFESVAPLARRLDGMKERGAKRKRSRNESFEPKRSHYDHSKTSHEASYSRQAKRKNEDDADDSEDLEARRKCLLRRADWLGTEPTRPLKMSFPSRRDREKIGRRRELKPEEIDGHVHTHKAKKLTPSKPPPNREAQRAVPRIPRQDEISVRVGSGIHGSQRTFAPPAGVQLGYPTGTGVVWSASDDMLDPNLSSGSMLLGNGDSQREEELLDTDNDSDQSCYESTSNDTSGHSKQADAADKQVDTRDKAFQSPVHHQTLDPTTFRSTPPVPVWRDSAQISSVHRPVQRPHRFHSRNGLSPDMTNRHNTMEHSLVDQLRACAKPEITSDEDHEWKQLVHLPSPSKAIQKPSRYSKGHTKDDHISISSESSDESSDDIEDYMPDRAEKDATLEQEGQTQEHAYPHLEEALMQTPTRQLEAELTRAADAEQLEVQQASNHDETVTILPAPSEVKQTEPELNGDQSMPTERVSEEENEVWFKYVFAPDLERYVKSPIMPRIRDPTPLISPLHSSDDLGSVQVEPSVHNSSKDEPPRNIHTGRLEKFSSDTESVKNKATAPRSIDVNYSTRAIASSSMFPLAEADESTAPTQMNATIHEATPQKVFFKKPVPFSGKKPVDNVIRLGGSGAEKKRKENRKAGRGGWVNRDGRGVVDSWEIPASSETEDIED